MGSGDRGVHMARVVDSSEVVVVGVVTLEDMLEELVREVVETRVRDP